MGPDVGAVVADEDGDVADDADVALGTIATDGAPLFEECELEITGDLKFGGEFGAGAVQGGGIAMSEVVGPLVPTLTVVALAQGVEKDEVLEPPRILVTEAIVGFAVAAAGVLQEMLRGLDQERNFGLQHALEVDGRNGIRQFTNAFLVDESTFGETVE